MRRPIKMDAGLRRRPKTNALFAPKTDAPSVLRTRDAPAPGCESTLRIANPIFFPQAKKAAGTADGLQVMQIPCDSPGKPRSDTPKPCGADARRPIPLARPSQRRASPAHGRGTPPWRRRRAYGRSRRAARRRTAVADRSGASRRRRLSW